LRNPHRGPIDINNPGTCQNIAMYLSLQLASQDTHNCIQRATIHDYTHDNEDSILSFYNVEKLIVQYTSVKSIEHDMCPDSCLASTGPYAALEICPLSSWKS
ncbi:hypothetical protein BDR03DRAFT_880773, partial [Suillus americanus]